VVESRLFDKTSQILVPCSIVRYSKKRSRVFPGGWGVEFTLFHFSMNLNVEFLFQLD